MVGSKGVINLFCWVLFIELVPTTGPVVGTSSPDDEDRASLRNVVILIF